MIWDILFTAILNILKWAINLIPTPNITIPSLSGLTNAVAIGKFIIGSTTFDALILSITFWAGVILVVGVLKFVYRKIPGIT